MPPGLEVMVGQDPSHRFAGDGGHHSFRHQLLGDFRTIPLAERTGSFLREFTSNFDRLDCDAGGKDRRASRAWAILEALKSFTGKPFGPFADMAVCYPTCNSMAVSFSPAANSNNAHPFRVRLRSLFRAEQILHGTVGCGIGRDLDCSGSALHDWLFAWCVLVLQLAGSRCPCQLFLTAFMNVPGNCLHETGRNGATPGGFSAVCQSQEQERH